MADVNKSVNIEIKGDSSKLNKSLGGASAAMAKMAKGVAGAAVALAGLAGAVMKVNQQVADMINELVDASSKTGVQVETLQALKLAAEGSGRSFADIEGSLIRFQMSMDAATRGTGRQAEAFAALGVQVKDNNGEMRDSNDVFNDTIQELSKMEAGTQRNTKVMTLFGKSASALIQSGFIDGMDKFNQRVKEFGLDVGPKATEEAANFQRAVADMNMVLRRALQDSVAALTGGQSLSSALVKATGGFIFMKTVVGDAFDFIGGVLNAVIGGVFSLGFALSQLDFTGLGKAVLDLSSGNPVAMVRGLKSMHSIAEQIQTTSMSLNQVNNDFANQAGKNLSTTIARATAARDRFVSGFDFSGGGGLSGGGGGRGGTSGAAGKTGAKKEADDTKKLLELRKEVDTIMGKHNEVALTREEKIKKVYDEQIKRLQEIAKISKGQVDTTTEQAELKKKLQEELHTSEMEMLAKSAQANEEFNQSIIDLKKQQSELVKELAVSTINTLGNIGKSTTSFFTSFASAQKQFLENTGQLTNEQAIRLHKLNQRAGVADVLINAAVATTKAFAQFGPIGGSIAAGAMAGLAGMQIAAINSTPSPKFHTGGMVDGADVVNGQLLRGEAVLSRRQVRDVGGEKGVKAIGNQPQVIVTNSFKHFDKYMASSLRSNSRLSRMKTRTGRK